MRYPGKELEIFNIAKVFQRYIFFFIKKYLKGNICEIGAGIGSFTDHYVNNGNKILVSDLDPLNFKVLKKKYTHHKNLTVVKGKIVNINHQFDTIIYLNVLEHIKYDVDEIKTAMEKLNPNGHLIFLVPAHQKLFTKFDKEIGHFRRYHINFFKTNKPSKLIIKKLIYLDLVGYVLYFLNKFFFKEEVYPSKTKVVLWDKLFIPITIVLDFFFNYRFGKNILCVYKKK